MMILGVSGKDVSVARHVLVTGGAGYVGSHACKALASAGYTPIAYDNLVHGHEWAVRWGPLVKGDILDKVRLDEVLGKYRPEAVMHFAAFAYVGESVGNPGKYRSEERRVGKEGRARWWRWECKE